MKFPRNLPIIIPFILISGIIINLILTIKPVVNKYFISDYWNRFPELKRAYYASVYADKNGSFLPDESLYAFSGGALITGTSPILIIPEVPPLGKYLIGLSAIVFQNENIVILFAGIISLILLYKIGILFYHSKTVALIPPFLLSFEPIFKNQLLYVPLLDIIQLAFMLAAFYCFMEVAKRDEKAFKLILSAVIFLGCFISTKFFATGITIVIAWYLSLFFYKEYKKITLLTVLLPVAAVLLLSTYVVVLFTGYPLADFLGIQKWIFLYNKGHLHYPFSVWPLLLANKWYVWWGSKPIISDSQWNITWPVLVITGISTIAFSFIVALKSVKQIASLLLWPIIYLLFLSIGDTSSRYFVILIPVLYVISVYGIQQSVLWILHKWKLSDTKKYV